MNKRRLLKLADLLEADAKNKKGICFDVATWGRTNTPDDLLSCGTTACAMGLAAVSGAFKRQGLRCQIKRGWIYIGFGRRWDAIYAASRLFEITERQACDLFADTWSLNHITGAAGEREIANRIRDFVAADD